MIYGGNRILPEQRFLRHQRAEVARERSHVAMRQLVPRLGEGVRQLLWMIVETLRDRRIDGIDLQGEVGCEHERGMPLRRVVGIRNSGRPSSILGPPLVRAGGAFREFPVKAE